MKTMIKEIIHKGGSRLILIWALALLAEIIAEVTITVLMPQFKGLTMDALVAKNVLFFYHYLPIFAVLLAGYASFSGIKKMFVGNLSAQVRVGLTKLLMKKWVGNKGNSTFDNPDGRIAEDIRLCTDRFFEIFTEVVISLLIVIGLIISLANQPILLVSAFGYILLSLLLAYLFKNPLVRSRTRSQVCEQTLRTGLVKYKLGTGDHSFKSSLENVRYAYIKYMIVKGLYKLFFEYKNAVTAVLPLLILFPTFVAGTITAGQLFAGVASFDLLVINATISMNYYTDITDASASWKRVKELWEE